jgi:hypothetical protein
MPRRISLSVMPRVAPTVFALGVAWDARFPRVPAATASDRTTTATTATKIPTGDPLPPDPAPFATAGKDPLARWAIFAGFPSRDEVSLRFPVLAT